MDELDGLLSKLYIFLTENNNINNNIVRKHTRKLYTLSDLSFPLDISSWFALIKNTPNITSIFDYSSSIHKINVDENILVKESATWNLPLASSSIINNNCHLKINRGNAFRRIINEVSKCGSNFGSFNADNDFTLTCDEPEIQKLTDLRVTLITKVGNNFLKFNHVEAKTCVKVSNRSTETNAIIIGSVLNSTGSKDTTTLADDYYRQRTIDMRLMAEHKYGIRITSKPGWSDVFEKLGSAAVVIEMLQNKPSHTTIIDTNNHYMKNSSFILYNCARLATLFKEFDKRVDSNMYPTLPPIDQIDFNLLVQPEEWELFYVYVIQFPHLIKSCMREITTYKLNLHYLVSSLVAMSSTFSVYYRRIKLLTEPRPHLFPVLFARIYFLKSLEQVLHNGLSLLGIEPVKQM